MTLLKDLLASGQFLWSKWMFLTVLLCRDLRADEDHWRKDLSYLIVPHCLDPQALQREAALFLLWLPQCGMWFPSRVHICQSGSGHRFCGLCLPTSRSQLLALGVGGITIYLCPCLHVFDYASSPCTNIQVKHGYNTNFNWDKAKLFFLVVVFKKNPSTDIKKNTPEDPLTGHFSVFRSWQSRMKMVWVKSP